MSLISQDVGEDSTSLLSASPSRRGTEEAVVRLAEEASPGNSKWYESGNDFCFYASAHQTCLSSKDRLMKILSPAELQDLEATRGVDTVLSYMNEVAEEIQKKTHKSVAERRTADFINGFCDFAVKTSGVIITLLPQSPEYTVTFGIIILIFKTVVTKKERQETLMTFIRSLADRLPVVDFYKNIFPTYDMKLAVAHIYVGITKLLEDALIYFRGGRLSKLLDAIVRPKEGKFNQQIVDIDRAIDRLNSLKTVANIAQQSDMKNMLRDAGHVIARIHQNLEGTTAALGQSIVFLNQKIDAIQTQTDHLLEFESSKYALSLQQIIVLPSHSYEDFDFGDFTLARTQKFSLTPKDAWDENGILDDLLSWSTGGRSTLLWIGGSSGNQDSWVTPFALDMIEAFRTQELTLLFTLCDSHPRRAGAHRFLTPNILLRRLIAQLLGRHTRLAFQNPRLFNEHRFRSATRFDALWAIFAQLVGLVGEEVFLIIDRIEEVEPDEDGDVQDRLLPRLLELADRERYIGGRSSSGSGRVSVIVTSVQQAPEEIADDKRLSEVYIDTGKRPRKKW